MNRFPLNRSRKEKLEHAQNLVGLGAKAFAAQNYSEGLLFYQEAYLIRAGLLGPEHHETARVAEELGRAISQMEEPALARSFFEQSMAQHNGLDARQSTYLGILIERVGDVLNNHDNLPEARGWYMLATSMLERAVGVEDRAVLYLLQKQVGLNYLLGDLTEARRLLERVLTIDRGIFGAEHPKVAADLSSLGNVLKDLGDLSGARDIFSQAVALEEKSLNWDNPRLAADLNSLGEILRELGDLTGAKTCLERVLRIDEQSFGEAHPKLASDYASLGHLLRQLGDLENARIHLARAAAIDERALGPAHPKLAGDYSSLGDILCLEGRLPEAREYFQRAIQTGELAFGPQHPRLAPELQRLGEVLFALGSPEEARACFQRAYQIYDRFLPAGHPNLVVLQDWLRRTSE